MKHCSLFCAGIWPFLLLPLLLLVPLLFFMWHAIEDRVAENASQSLASQHDWANVQTINRGRDVLLLGTAPSAEAVESAKKLALSGDGVRVVSFSGDIAATPIPEAPAPEPAELQLTLVAGKVRIEGVVDSQDTVNRLLAAASSQYGAENIVNQLTIGANTEKLSIQPAQLLAAAEGIQGDGNIAINGSSIVLSGNVTSLEIQQSIESALGNSFGDNIDNRLIVLVERDECQDLLNELLTVAQINFATSKATIAESSNGLLNKIVDTAKRCPDIAFEISGHTDSTGAAASNLALSEQRAQAVVDRIVSLGLSADRFVARGYGQTQPVGNNKTAAGRAANRRIEFKVTN